MSSDNEYRRFAVASLDQSRRATDLPAKLGFLIMAEAWFELAEQTTPLMERDTGEAHRIVERPLIGATFPRRRIAAQQSGERQCKGVA